MRANTLKVYPTAEPPFGSVMNTRNWAASKYRYGFNGEEKDDEINVDNGSYDFGSRIYDSRLGRWLSCDPDESKYPDQSTFSYSFNNPLYFNDPTGKGGKVTITKDKDPATKLPILKVTATIFLHNDNMADLSNKATTVKNNIENQWNHPVKVNVDGTTTEVPATTMHNGKEYKVVFEVKVVPITDAEAKTKEATAKKNFGKHVDENIVFADNDGIGSNMGGGNTGEFDFMQELNGGNTTFAEEFGHILGFADHKVQANEDFTGNGDNSAHVQVGEAEFGVSVMSSIVDNYDNIAQQTPFNQSAQRVTTNDIGRLNFGYGLGRNIRDTIKGVISDNLAKSHPKKLGEMPQ